MTRGNRRRPRHPRPISSRNKILDTSHFLCHPCPTSSRRRGRNRSDRLARDGRRWPSGGDNAPQGPAAQAMRPRSVFPPATGRRAPTRPPRARRRVKHPTGEDRKRQSSRARMEQASKHRVAGRRRRRVGRLKTCLHHLFTHGAGDRRGFRPGAPHAPFRGGRRRAGPQPRARTGDGVLSAARFAARRHSPISVLLKLPYLFIADESGTA